jgi:hypothetical protein
MLNDTCAIANAGAIVNAGTANKLKLTSNDRLRDFRNMFFTPGNPQGPTGARASCVSSE